ncbi:putative inhibitor of toxin/antitoxin system [Erwinia phage Stepyanka]|uniref:Gp4.5 n=2 Tax=Elunavirus TaxID=2732681 RepID=G0YQ62_9CAUD|nr:gp4.5 [Erwinia phage vB_EamP-L1]AEJ81489.1 gp4.5 [Erwinia phage vB_EamP-L1]UTQ80047.1 putative inhibitor of toxin/antitoxin system [Erwinia phage Stepyanka]
MPKHTTTLRMPDTADQWTRRIHVNVRGGKTTMVYRWKSRKDGRDHTQRMTLDDAQVARLTMALGRAAAHAIGDDADRRKVYMEAIFAGSKLAE